MVSIEYISHLSIFKCSAIVWHFGLYSRFQVNTFILKWKSSTKFTWSCGFKTSSSVAPRVIQSSLHHHHNSFPFCLLSLFEFLAFLLSLNNIWHHALLPRSCTLMSSLCWLTFSKTSAVFLQSFYILIFYIATLIIFIWQIMLCRVNITIFKYYFLY